MDLVNQIRYGKIIEKDFSLKGGAFYLERLENLKQASMDIYSGWFKDRGLFKKKKWNEIIQNVSGEEIIQILKSNREFENSLWDLVSRKKGDKRYYLFKQDVGKDMGLDYFETELRVIGRI